MPAHTAGAVQVSVVSLGIASSGSYTYNTGPALLFPAPPGGEAGVAYSDQLTVTGGTSPFTWSVSAGTLPPGLTLNASTGLLSGTPTAAGTYSFTVKVTDRSGLTATEPVTLTIVPGPSLSFPAPPAGWTRTVYLYTLTESGGIGPFAWSVSSGALPPGVSLSADGSLTGTPTATGTFSFTVKVTDANGQSATQATSVTISAGVSTTFSAPPAAVVGTAYSTTLTATGGTTPYTWSVNAGTLPPGLTLSSAGVLSGTPTAAGSYPFTVNVIDKNNGIATTSITLVVSAGLTLTFRHPAGRAGRRPLHRHADGGGRHHSVHLVGERRDAARRDHAERLHRGAGRDPDGGRYLQLHHQGDRRGRPDGHPRDLDHGPGRCAEHRRRAPAWRPRPRAARSATRSR